MKKNVVILDIKHYDDLKDKEIRLKKARTHSVIVFKDDYRGICETTIKTNDDTIMELSAELKAIRDEDGYRDTMITDLKNEVKRLKRRKRFLFF